MSINLIGKVGEIQRWAMVGLMGLFVIGLLCLVVLTPNAVLAIHKEEPSELFLSLIEDARWGESEAQYTVAMMYAAGEGVEKDQVEASKWFEKAAHEGHPYAMFKIAERYEKGLGVTRDPEKAIQWYRKAAETGFRQGDDKAYYDQVRKLQIQQLEDKKEQEQLEEDRKYEDQIRREQNRLQERMNRDRYRYDYYYPNRRRRIRR